MWARRTVLTIAFYFSRLESRRRIAPAGCACRIKWSATAADAEGSLGLSGPVVAVVESYWPAKSQATSGANYTLIPFSSSFVEWGKSISDTHTRARARDLESTCDVYGEKLKDFVLLL